MSRTALEPASELLVRGLAARREAGARLFEDEAARIAELCHAVAERCARGGRLLALRARRPAPRTPVTWRSSSCIP